jgi:uncharacterized iron-regulated protein
VALKDALWIADQPSARIVTLAEMLDSLAKEEVVFLGETHLDDNTHRLELAVYEGLAARRGGQVVLALEMFERDVQPVLDDYLAGRIGEHEFLMRARPWHNYRSGYRPLLEAAKRMGLPVVASNAPAALRMKVGRGGRAALDELLPEERALLPERLFDNTEAYWARFDRAVRGHMGVAGGDRVYSGQSLWDNAMGESCARSLEERPGWLVLHVNGGFHSAYRGGAVHQLLLRRPATRVKVVEAAFVDDFHTFDPFGAADRADYVAYVLGRARDSSDGFHAVAILPELRYRLHLPPGLAAGRTPPLLLWLGADGLRAADALAPLKEALGEEAAIAVVEPPYPLVADDLAPGGRWFSGETFHEDLGVLGGGLRRILTYLLANYPLDRRYVVLGGEGTGATVIAANALYTKDVALFAIASAPKRFGKLRELTLPGPGEGDPRRLLVLAPGADEAWWREEAEAWAPTGLSVTVENTSGFAPLAEHLRAALGLPAAPAKEGAPTALLLRTDTPRARHWAELYALRCPGPARVVGSAGEAREGERVQPLWFEGEGSAVPEGAAPPLRAEDLMDGRGLPLAAGPFGGTTILVVPKSASDEERAAWKKLEETDAIKKRSRFARLVVLFETEEARAGPFGAFGGRPVRRTGLAEALQAIKDAGRSVALVVPAAFCADAEAMAALRAEARPFEEILDLAYLPGLGGGLAPSGPP